MIAKTLKITYDMDDGAYQSVVILNAPSEELLKQKIHEHCERYPVMYYETLFEPEEMTVEMWGSNTFEDMEN